jgi:hypothetical protein
LASQVINRFLGHYDGNPVNLAPLSPKDSAPLYVEMTGGSAKIIAKGRQLMAPMREFLCAGVIDSFNDGHLSVTKSDFIQTPLTGVSLRRNDELYQRPEAVTH